MFHSLLKAHAQEARVVVCQALEYLTPAMPGRMEDGNVSVFGELLIEATFYYRLRERRGLLHLLYNFDRFRSQDIHLTDS